MPTLIQGASKIKKASEKGATNDYIRAKMRYS